MGDLLKLAEQLTKKAVTEADDQQENKLTVTETGNGLAMDYRTTTYQKEEKPMPKDERPATRKQKGWIYYNLKLSTYSLQISRTDMSVLIERSQRSKEEKAKVQFRLRQMGAKECK